MQARQITRANCYGLLLALLTLRAAYGQANSAPSNPQAVILPKDKALPQVTISPRDLAPAINNFISTATGASVLSQDHPLGRWNMAICPAVAGLPREEGQRLFDRLVDTLTSLGRPLGTTGCRLNFFVIVSAHPEAELKALWNEAVQMFGEAQEAQKFIETPRPVRIWYNASLVDAEGGRGIDPIGKGALPAWALGTRTFRISDVPRQDFDTVTEITSVIAVVDYARVVGLDWHQVADYIAMAGLTEIKLDADVGKVPTILRLFTAPEGERPQRITDWDKAFVKELYLTDRAYRHQRADISKKMYRDLASP